MRAQAGDGRTQGCHVYLDGMALKGVVEADEERGYIVRFKRNASGLLCLNEDRTEVAREQLTGVVRIDLPARYWVKR